MSNQANGRPRIYKNQADESYLVVTGERGGLEYGRLVSPDLPPSREQPVQTICAFMPQDDFQPYHGDPAPVLAMLKGE